jgi:hypothetical protein
MAKGLSCVPIYCARQRSSYHANFCRQALPSPNTHDKPFAVCDTLGFQLGLFNANGRVNLVKHVDVGPTLVNLGHHLENLANKP